VGSNSCSRMWYCDSKILLNSRWSASLHNSWRCSLSYLLELRILGVILIGSKIKVLAVKNVILWTQLCTVTALGPALYLYVIITLFLPHLATVEIGISCSCVCHSFSHSGMLPKQLKFDDDVLTVRYPSVSSIIPHNAHPYICEGHS